ncbi:MAG: hypothetical protein BGN88_09860 [Clostridiales bacterium 43-6]|nr:MAG: hypothetical protein BGN88_09860 [Clostridiales bacterium 43-6]
MDYFKNVLLSTNNTPIMALTDNANTINLSIGEPHFDIHPEIIDAIQKSLSDKDTHYSSPQGLLQLREKYLEKNFKFFDSSFSSDNVIIGAGVSNLLTLLIISTLKPGDSVLLVEPYYFSYIYLLKQFNISIITIPENFCENDLHNIKNKIKMILFSNPSNPSGYCFSNLQLKLLANFAEKKGSLIVSDEIYSKYVYTNNFISIGSIYHNSCILNGFSKSHSMTGLRLGVAVGPNCLIKKMVEIQTHSLICVPTCIQKGGIMALNINIQERVETYRKNRDRIYEYISKHFICSKPQGGFYIFFDSKKIDYEFVDQVKKECNIIMTPGNLFTQNKNFIRIAYCVSENILEKAINIFNKSSIFEIEIGKKNDY